MFICTYVFATVILEPLFLLCDGVYRLNPKQRSVEHIYISPCRPVSGHRCENHGLKVWTVEYIAII